jgi:hypothetical protein|tara:strand:- start:226 stop:906 length:681 start_codon:yes stop_codon:yes gene_type:complete
MKDINFINEQVDKIIQYKINSKYSFKYKHPKERFKELLIVCEDKEQIFDVLKEVKRQIVSELGGQEMKDMFGEKNHCDDYLVFHNEIMVEVDRVYNIYNFKDSSYDSPYDSPYVSSESNEVKNVEVVEVVPELNNLENRTKIILMQELGILSLLKKEESFKNATNLAKFIAELFSGKKDDVNKVYESIRTDLSYILDKKAKKTPYTPRQCKKVNSLLSMYGLPQMK